MNSEQVSANVNPVLTSTGNSFHQQGVRDVGTSSLYLITLSRGFIIRTNHLKMYTLIQSNVQRIQIQVIKELVRAACARMSTSRLRTLGIKPRAVVRESNPDTTLLHGPACPTSVCILPSCLAGRIPVPPRSLLNVPCS